MQYDILINKSNKVGSNFVPKDLITIEPKLKGTIDPNRQIMLVKEAYDALVLLQEEAKKVGLTIDITSGYRSYSYQERVFNHYIESIGLELTEKRVALPGTSDHHSGLAIDYFSFRQNEDGTIYPYTDIKESDIEYQWMQENSYKFGFIIRFPKDKESVTGIMFEPWHIRYVGIPLATKLTKENKTLEEYHQNKQNNIQNNHINSEAKIYVFGHRKPDTDSVCSSIALAYLKQQLGMNATPRILSNVNNETKFVLDYFHIKMPKYLNDVRLQIRDAGYKKDFFVDEEKSIGSVYNIMESANASGIPIVDKNNKLTGLVTLKDIARDMINGNYTKICTSYDNILEVLKAEQILKFNDEIKGNILLASYRSTTFRENVRLDKDTILIVGDRHSILEYAVESKVKLIIVVGNGEIKDRHLDIAKDNKVNIIRTSLDSFNTSKLIGFTNYIKNIVTAKEPISFDIFSYLSDFIEVNNKTKHTNYPIIDKNKQCLGMIRMIDINEKRRKQVILVDHNQKSQSVIGLEEADIIEVIDHHNLGDITTSMPINFRNMAVGSTCTIVYNMFLENNVEIPKDIAGLLISGILSDTLILKSPTTTTIDKMAVDDLEIISEVNYEKYGFEMFKCGSSLKNRNIEEVIFEDLKIYSINDSTIGIGQVYTTNFDEIYSSIDKYIDTIDNISKNNGYLITAIFVTDIIKNGSYLIYNRSARHYLSDSFDIPNIEQGHYFDGFVSRKKQMLPPIIEVLEKK